VIRKLTDYNNSMGGLLMQAGIILTVTHKYPNNKTSYGEKNMGTFYSCYYEQNQFDILDTPSWVLVEKSDKNVLSLNAYRKFKESKKVRMR
jgi:hypothetical protein